MKMIRTFAFILVFLLFAVASFFSNTFSQSDNLLHNDITDIEKKNVISKEDYISIINGSITFIKSSEFKTKIIEKIRETAKGDQSDFDGKFAEGIVSVIESGTLKLAKSYGIKKETDLEKASKIFDHEPEIISLNETKTNIIRVVLIDVLNEIDSIDDIPNGIKKKLLFYRKRMESIVNPTIYENEQTENNENHQSLSKSQFIDIAQQAINYMKSYEFKDMIIKSIKKAAKNPKTFDSELSEAQMIGIESKMLEIVKPYGINSKEEMDAAFKQFEDDSDVKAFNETMMREIMGVMIGIYGDSGLLKSVPKSIRKKLEDGKKAMESMIAPTPQED
jgi:hypothetical protein